MCDVAVERYMQRYGVTEATRQFIHKNQQMYINGEWVDAQSGRKIEVIEPSTGALLALVPEGEAEDVDRAVLAAQCAFEEGEWSHLTAYDRQMLLLKLADLVEENAEELAEIESLDNGKSVAEAKEYDIMGSAALFRYMAGWATKIEGATRDVSISGGHITAYTKKEPVGVVGSIIPWNYPFNMAAWKIAAPLAVGCTVVLKPSELTPLSVLRLAELAEQAGYPNGVLNIVTGYGDSAGAALSAHQGVNKLSFTGSTVTGQKVARAALENITRVTLELGGKSPVIVLDDADIESAATGAAEAIFFNSGQVCSAGSRLLIHENIYDELLERVVEIANNIVVSPGLDPDCEMGPLVSFEHLQRVTGFIQRASEGEAHLMAGGETVISDRGYFLRPTVFANVAQDMEVVNEEVFGPVLSVQKFSDIEQAIQMANDTLYGLGASIWSNNLSLVNRMIPRLQAGTVWVNAHNLDDPSMPFGGYKRSGIGKDLGPEQLEHFLETKAVWINA